MLRLVFLALIAIAVAMLVLRFARGCARVMAVARHPLCVRSCSALCSG